MAILRCLFLLFAITIAPADAQVVGAVPATYFGLSTLHYATDVPDISYGLARSWDGDGLSWAESNTFPGVYNFSALDKFIAASQARSSPMIYTFGRTPRWASLQPNSLLSPYGVGQCAPPRNLANWDNYVRSIVIHAAGKIKYWEVWNDAANAPSYCGSVATMVLMTQHAYEIIKSMDAGAVILSPSVGGINGATWLDKFLKQGGKNYVDAIAFHGMPGETAENISTIVAAYKTVMQETGLSAKPLFDTQTSWSTGVAPTLTAVQEASFVAKYYLLDWSLGVSSAAWYGYDSAITAGQLWSASTGLSAAGTAYNQVYNWMVGATITTPCTEDGNKIWACTLTKPNGYQAQPTWINDSSMSVTVPANYTQYRDLTGAVHAITNNIVTIGDQPILLETGSIPLNYFNCSSSGVMGSANETCAVKITTAAESGGLAVSISSNNTAVTVPATVTIPANTTGANFTINVASVQTSQTATLTASAGGVSRTYTIKLNAATQTLGIGRTAIVFPDAVVNNTATQSFILTATGTEPVVITSAVMVGANFILSGATFPLTLEAGQAVTLTVQFYPTTAGTSTGHITITSNALDNSAAIINLTGTALIGPSDPGTPAKTFSYSGSTLTSTFIPPNPTAGISTDLFAMTIYWLAKPGDMSNQTPFPSYNLSTLRLWDVDYWANIEYISGKYNWTKMDADISTGTQNGVKDFIFTFGQPPNWASTNPTDPCTDGEGPGTCSPPNMSAYDDFATHVVQRYCGKILYYEPWNEPNNSLFWDGTNAQLLTIAQHLYSIAKNTTNCGCTNGVCAPNGGVNPNKVLLPPIAGVDPQNVAWLDAYLAAANMPNPYADIAAFHGYVWHGYLPEQIISQMQNLKQTLGKYGLSNLELWNTETSFELNSYYTEQQQISWLMRSHMAEAVMGISRLAWYSYDSCTWGTLWSSPLCGSNTTGTVGQLTQAGIAYGTIENWFIGARLTQCLEYQNGLWSCELQRAGGYDAWMLWNTSTTTPNITVPVPANLDLVQYRDWQNNVTPLSTQITITSTPVLLENNL